MRKFLIRVDLTSSNFVSKNKFNLLTKVAAIHYFFPGNSVARRLHFTFFFTQNHLRTKLHSPGGTELHFKPRRGLAGGKTTGHKKRKDDDDSGCR